MAGAALAVALAALLAPGSWAGDATTTLASNAADLTTVQYFTRDICSAPCDPDNLHSSDSLYMSNFSDPTACHGVWEDEDYGIVGGRWHCQDSGELHWTAFEGQDCSGDSLYTETWLAEEAARFFGGTCICTEKYCKKMTASARMVPPPCLNSTGLGCDKTRANVTAKGNLTECGRVAADFKAGFCKGFAAGHVLNKTECTRQGLPCDCAHELRSTTDSLHTLTAANVGVEGGALGLTVMMLCAIFAEKRMKRVQEVVHPAPVVGVKKEVKVLDPPDVFADAQPTKPRKSKMMVRALRLQRILLIVDLVMQIFLVMQTFGTGKKAALTLYRSNCSNAEGESAAWNLSESMVNIRLNGIVELIFVGVLLLFNAKATMDANYGGKSAPMLSAQAVMMVATFVMTVLDLAVFAESGKSEADRLFAAMPGTPTEGVAWCIDSVQKVEFQEVHGSCSLAASSLGAPAPWLLLVAIALPFHHAASCLP